jgi:hypothetical protein
MALSHGGRGVEPTEVSLWSSLLENLIDGAQLKKKFTSFFLMEGAIF